MTPTRRHVTPCLVVLVLSTAALLLLAGTPPAALAHDAATPIVPTVSPTPDGQPLIDSGTPVAPNDDSQQPATPTNSLPACSSTDTPLLEINAVSDVQVVWSGSDYLPATLTLDLSVTGATTSCGDAPWTLRLTALTFTSEGATYLPVSLAIEGNASSGTVSSIEITDLGTPPILASGRGDGAIRISFTFIVPPDAPRGTYQGSLGLVLTPDTRADAVLPNHHHSAVGINDMGGGAVHLGTWCTQAACAFG